MAVTELDERTEARAPTPEAVVTAGQPPRRPAPPRLIRSTTADATTRPGRPDPSSPPVAASADAAVPRAPRHISRRLAAAGIGAVAMIPIGGVVAAALNGSADPAPGNRSSTPAPEAQESSAPPAAPSPPMFPDVPRSHPRSEDIEWAADAGLLTGDDTGRFRPDAGITRGVLALALHRFAGEPEVSVGTPIFTDLSGYPADHVTALQWTGNLGILWGDEEMRALPDAELERSGLAAALRSAFAAGVQAAGRTVDVRDESTFADIDEEDPMASALGWAAATGCLDGGVPAPSAGEDAGTGSIGDTDEGAEGAISLEPSRTATRGELATALHAAQHLLDD